jgi:TonB C terminal
MSYLTALNGKVLNTRLAESSGKPMLDKYMAKVVQAASPFGVLPAKVHFEQTKPFDQLVYVTRFNFEHDPVPDDRLAVTDRCKWR